jgi:hypothetical protein
MKNHLLLLLLFILGGSLFIGSCTKNQPLQSLRWPPDTITAVHVGGNIYAISSGTFRSKTKMRVEFTWPKVTDTTTTHALVHAGPPVPWPPDTTFYPIGMKLIRLVKPDTMK